MNFFIKKILSYLGLLITTMIIIFILRFDSYLIYKLNIAEEIFFKKKKSFENFIKDKNSINIILGSSLVEDLMIPDSIGKNWFSFTNEAQNIYNSYQFLKFYIDSVRIDTILIGIQPFDFPFSYLKDRDRHLPRNNSRFYVFGSDSINRFPLLRTIAEIKQSIFPNLNDIIRLNKKNKIHKSSHDLWSGQGFSGRINYKNISLDSLYKYQDFNEREINGYFYNVRDRPNMKYFDLFNNLTKYQNIETLYLLTPKSKYYHFDLEKHNYLKHWSNVLDSLKRRKVEIWNYEKMNTEDLNFEFYRDDTHSNYNGAKAFTKIIKSRLRKE